MVEIKLYGGVTYNNFGIINSPITNVSNNFLTKYDGLKFKPMDWTEDTILNANFSGDINGSNFEGGFEGLKYYRIFKTIGNSEQLYFVAETEDANKKIIEDYIVGDRCNYTYYIYPVCDNIITIDNTEHHVEVIRSPLKTKAYSQNSSCLKLIGLIPSSNSDNTYTIDENNMWHIYLNVKDNGLSLNYDKVFTDAHSPMPKETSGIKKYISKNISGLIGKIDCKNHNYIDSYDDILNFKNFVSSGSLKLLIDLRGFIIPGDIEEDAEIIYNADSNYDASANFTFRQLEDFKNIVIKGRVLEKNPLGGDST